MPLPLHQSRAVAELAAALYSFLPGAPHPYANQEVSFEGAARAAGVGRNWRGGSKRPAIADLLGETLERSPGRFCALIIEIVRGGLKYRGTRDPITREELTHVNELVAAVGFKIPELHDAQFLRSLPSEGSAARELPEIYSELHKRLLDLSALEPASRGYAFEKFLQALFEASGLSPRASFRITGEQIDGSFIFDGATYLLEARWQNAPVSEADLLVLAGKVGGKAEWSRGVFVSVSAFSDGALSAFAAGKRTNIICISGLDLHDMFAGGLHFRDVLAEKVRRAAETNEAYVTVRELF